MTFEHTHARIGMMLAKPITANPENPYAHRLMMGPADGRAFCEVGADRIVQEEADHD